MQSKRPWSSFIVLGVAAAASALASATGISAAGSGAVLGQTLDFAVQVRLDSGDALTAECVSAEVTLGERVLPSGLVRTSFESLAADLVRLRVLTRVAVDEPVVGVLLNVGCTGKLSRRFVVLADPPAAPEVAAPAYAAALPEAPAAGNAAVPRSASTVASALRSVDAVADALAAPGVAEQRLGAWPPGAKRPAASATAPRRPWRVAAAPARAEARRARRARTGAAQAAPRLRLEPATPEALGAQADAVEQALQAVAQAASAAQAAASAASTAALRIGSLEREVERWRAQARGSRDLAEQAGLRLAQAEGAVRWLWPLLTAALLLAALAAWLAWRLAAAQRQRQQGWRQVAPATRSPHAWANPQLTNPIPFVTSEIVSADFGLAPGAPSPAWALPPAPDGAARSAHATSKAGADAPRTAHPEVAPALVRTEVPPPGAVSGAAAPGEVSIDELIDLVQQAEFLVILGQDDAAIEMLAEHLRHTGGGGPLPYLKLMEIHRRRGDRSEYARLRSRFTDRFDASAPDWEDDLASGRSLEDYPGVVPRLQQVWAGSAEAMAEIEVQLRCKRRGDLFDLPAYGEVLLLYSVARDLFDRESPDPGDMDLLLPLAGRADFTSTAPAPLRASDRGAGGRSNGSEKRKATPVDLDLTVRADQPSSIFDGLQDPPPRQR